MGLRAVVRTLAGVVFGFDKNGNPVWRRTDAKQLAIDLNGSNVPYVETTINGVTTQYSLTGDGGGASTQYQYNGANLGSTDATTLNIASGEKVTASRSSNTITVSYVDPNVILGLTDGGVVDNAAVFKSYLNPSEGSGTIVAADGVMSSIPTSQTGLLIKSTVDVDPQISMYWNSRGGVTIIPDARIPALTPGTPGTIVRTGGGAPSSVFRIVRRASGLNKQAYEPMIGGFNIDGTGVNNSSKFTTVGSAVITSSNHGLHNGDLIYFDKDPDGTGLPTGTPAGTGLFIVDESIATAYTVTNAATNTFQVSNPAGAAVNPGAPLTAITAGKGVWSTNVHGIRIPNCQPSANSNDPDQNFDSRKNYACPTLHDIDVQGMSGSGIVSEPGSGRGHFHSVRAISNRVHGIDIGSNDTIMSGHWATGSNGGFGLHKGSGTGLYAWGGNCWGNPTYRSLNCGAVYLRDTAYFIIGGTEFNDWGRFDGINNYNAAGALIGNMCHPHAENFSSDGVCIDVQNSNDTRLQAHFGIRGYQGMNLFGNAYSRTENISPITTPFNFPDANYMSGGSDTTGKAGSAPQYLIDLGGVGPGGDAGRVSMTQIFDGYCTVPDAKPYTGPFSSVSFSIGAHAQMNWPAHPFVVGDRFRLHSTGMLPGGLTGDTQDYYVATIPDADHVTFSTTYGGSDVTTSGAIGSGHTAVFVGTMPYHLSGNAQTGGYAFDSFRGAHYIWSSKGTYPKIIIGSAHTGTQTQPWEGNPNYYMEVGSLDKTGGSFRRNALYGMWEMAQALAYQDTAVDSAAIASPTFSITVDPGRRYVRRSLSGGTFTAGTFTLPGGQSASQDLRIVVKGQAVTALTWAFTNSAAFTNNGITPPSTIPAGGMVLDLWYERDLNTYTVLGCETDGGLIGRVDGVAQPAGVVGEEITSFLSSSLATALSTGSAVTSLASVTLTRGDWRVTGNMVVTSASTASTQVTVNNLLLTTVSSADFTATDGTRYYASRVSQPNIAVTSSGLDMVTAEVGQTTVTVTSTAGQQVWLNTKPSYTGNVVGWGGIRARRVN